MYRRPKFLEVLLAIRQEMAREADYDVDLFAEMVRSGRSKQADALHSLEDPAADTETGSQNGKPSSKRKTLTRR